jgi:hypothetical protein
LVPNLLVALSTLEAGAVKEVAASVRRALVTILLEERQSMARRV